MAALAAAPFVEKYGGTEAAHRHIYGSWWFAGLWVAGAGAAIFLFCAKRSYRKMSLAAMHLSFVVMLAGALCTKLWGERGHIVLHQGGEGAAEGIALPFALSLDTFYIQYYEGTNTPLDYVSIVSVEDGAGGRRQGQVSMNNIFAHRGYRFYQSSFMAGGRASVLSINHDPLGIGVTYAGYALFLLSGLWLIMKGMFRRSRKVKCAAAAVLLCLLPLGVQGKDAAVPVPAVSEAQARQFGNLWILCDGRITSVSVFAHDFTLKLTGKTSVGGLNAEQVLAGFLFFPEQWRNVALFDIKDPALKRLLNAQTQKASFADFFDGDGNYKLTTQPRSKETDRLSDKVQLINMLHSGAPLRLFPLPAGDGTHWYTPTENFPAGVPQETITFVRTILTEYYTALHSSNEAAADSVLRLISGFQAANAGGFLPSSARKQVEILYRRHNVVPMLFKFNLGAGALCLLLLFVLKRERHRRRSAWLFMVQLAHSFGLLTISIGLRTYAGGRLPFASGFEVMLLMAWIAMLLTIVFRRRTMLALPFGLMLSGCALLVAHLGMSNPKITPLLPVLSSPLLSLHVSVIMIAYVLLAFTALNSALALLMYARSRQASPLQTMRLHTIMCLRPALLLLGIGIVVGAMWANVSWGRYWSWDPKETWALITFLAYAYVLYRSNVHPAAFHLMVLASFAAVLMTYFGVNCFFGGLHGYN